MASEASVAVRQEWGKSGVFSPTGFFRRLYNVAQKCDSSVDKEAELVQGCGFLENGFLARWSKSSQRVHDFTEPTP